MLKPNILKALKEYDMPPNIEKKIGKRSSYGQDYFYRQSVWTLGTSMTCHIVPRNFSWTLYFENFYTSYTSYFEVITRKITNCEVILYWISENISFPFLYIVYGAHMLYIV